MVTGAAAACGRTPRGGTHALASEDHQKCSLGAKKERVEAICKAEWDDGWRLHKVYCDTESGTHMNRPGLEEMLYDEAFMARIWEETNRRLGAEKPDVDREMLNALVGDFEKVMAEGTSPQESTFSATW